MMAAAGTFGALPFASMISALQSGELRKHSPVRLNDLSQTSANVSRRYSAPWSTQPAYHLASSGLQAVVIDKSTAHHAIPVYL
jgi:hypothetical protein